MFGMLGYILCLQLLFARISVQQKDPLSNFCRRFGHQSAVIDRRLYLDGGLLNWNPISQNPSNYTNTWLLYNDLDTSPSDIATPQLFANLSKNGSIPDVSGGVLWADEVNKRFYLYGGDYNGIPPNAFSLLSYDVLNDQWDSYEAPNTPVQSVSYGAGVGISELGEGYMLGGWLSNNSVPGWNGGPLATSTLINYDMDTGKWTNSTGPDSTPRAEGAMVYLPASNNGVLVYFGGLAVPGNNGSVVGVPMSEIHIYDIASSNWYTQTAGGDVPDMRRRFCAGATWAPDKSSYNIYIYGGAGFDANVTGFDDVYILTLPSFTWIKWWPSSPGAGNPHHSLTCNVIDGAQMLIIGGTFPLTDNCDSPKSWGTHTLDLGQQNSEKVMWGAYQPNLTSYVVPTAIVSVVGGSSLGGATATAPAGGFDNRDLAVYFTQHASVAARTPTRSVPGPTSSSSSSSKLSTGAIAGIAVGGAIALVAILIGAWLCIRRHRRNKFASQPAPTYTSGIQEYPHSSYPQSPNSAYHQQSPPLQYPPLVPPPQLPTHPVELSGADSPRPMHEIRAPKYDSPVGQDNTYILHGDWEPRTPPPQHAQPILGHTPTSPQPSTYSARTELSDSNPTLTYTNQPSSILRVSNQASQGMSAGRTPLA